MSSASPWQPTSAPPRPPSRFALGAAMAIAAGIAAHAFFCEDRVAAFKPFFDAAERAWTGGDVYEVEGWRYPYPPAFYVLLAPLGRTGDDGGLLWFTASLLLAFASLRLLARVLERGRTALAGAAAAAGVAGIARALDAALRQSDPSVLVLALVVATIWAYVTHRDEAAGLLAGLAIALKVTPALFLLYFAWKRRWRVVAWTAAGLGLFAVLAPAALFGWGGALALDRAFGARLWNSVASSAPAEIAAVAVLGLGLLALARPAPDEVRLSRRVLLELGGAAVLMLLASPDARAGHFVLLLVPFAAMTAGALERGRRAGLLPIALAALLANAGALVPEPAALALAKLAGLALLVLAILGIRRERAAEAAADAVPAPTDLELSAFFPAYDEAGNIERVVARALEVLPRIARKYEVIVVDDASRDATPEIARSLAEAHPDVVRHVRHPQNRGYGGAVKTGLSSARYDLVFFSDGDGQFDLGELPEFVRPLAGGRADAVLGYRRRRQDPLIRKVNGYCWGALVRTLFGIGSRDIDCAFKVLPTKLIQRLDLKSEGALISTEILAKLDRAGCRTVERGVSHLPRERGTPTGGNPRVILRAFRELFRFRRELSRWS